MVQGAALELLKFYLAEPQGVESSLNEFPPFLNLTKVWLVHFDSRSKSEMPNAYLRQAQTSQAILGGLDRG